MVVDLINGLFESLGGVMILPSCWRLYKDKVVRGVAITPTIFFVSWGLWNLYFYPAYGAWFSFAGAVFIEVVNLIWFGMAVYYTWGKRWATQKRQSAQVGGSK